MDSPYRYIDETLPRDLLKAKLNAYDFDINTLNLLTNYLSSRKQRTKISTSCNNWSDMKSGLPQGFILGPLLFNIHINDIVSCIDYNSIRNY